MLVWGRGEKEKEPLGESRRSPDMVFFLNCSDAKLLKEVTCQIETKSDFSLSDEQMSNQPEKQQPILKKQ